MGKTNGWLAVLAAAGLGLGSASAQIPTGPYSGGASEVAAPSGMAPGAPAAGAAPYDSARGDVRLSTWIQGDRCDCCGPLGDHNPAQSELYVRSGVSLPIGEGTLENSITTGWMIQSGFRAILFDTPGDRAWTIDVGLTNIYNYDKDVKPIFPVFNVLVPDPIQGGQRTIPSSTTMLRSLNRTYVNLGFGREWWLYGPARDTHEGLGREGLQWRVGIDAGGRWGTAKAQVDIFQHFTDTIAAVYAAAHSDVDIPCGCCTFHAGLRAEWDYTWSDVLQIQNKSDVESINFLVTFGVRY
jgi:hypothetical protein